MTCNEAEQLLASHLQSNCNYWDWAELNASAANVRQNAKYRKQSKPMKPTPWLD